MSPLLRYWIKVGMVIAIGVSIWQYVAIKHRAERVAQQAYEKQIEQCRDELAKKVPMIPIIGGGYLDTRYFAFNVPSVVYKDGECGTDTFVTNLYWTGQKIVPAKEEFTGMLAGAVPQHWLRFGIGAVFGNLRQARACQSNPSLDFCMKGYTPPGYPPTWPQERIVKPKHYPGLEIWLPPTPIKDIAAIHFVLSDWRREDGRPRTVNCDLPGYQPWKMTKEEFENIDFGTHMFPCQVEYSDFTFKGGAARVHTGTEALKDITPLLKALHQYISNSIIQEE